MKEVDFFDVGDFEVFDFFDEVFEDGEVGFGFVVDDEFLEFFVPDEEVDFVFLFGVVDGEVVFEVDDVVEVVAFVVLVDDGGEFVEVVFAGFEVFEEDFAFGETRREGLDFGVERKDFVEGERFAVGDFFELFDEEVALVDDVFEFVVQVREFDGELVDRVEQLFEVVDLVFVFDEVVEVGGEFVDVVFEVLDDFFFVCEEDFAVLDVVVFFDGFAEFDEGDLFVGFFLEVFGESLVLFAFCDLALEVFYIVEVFEEVLEVEQFGAFGVDFVD